MYQGVFILHLCSFHTVGVVSENTDVHFWWEIDFDILGAHIFPGFCSVFGDIFIAHVGDSAYIMVNGIPCSWCIKKIFVFFIVDKRHSCDFCDGVIILLFDLIFMVVILEVILFVFIFSGCDDFFALTIYISLTPFVLFNIIVLNIIDVHS